MIRIAAKRDGFRRCGVAHSATPTDWATGVFSLEQLGVLLTEPMLVVEVLEDPIPGFDALIQQAAKERASAAVRQAAKKSLRG